MEWIEVTGETMPEAEERALQMLGIERAEAEFRVLEEPKSGILRLRKTPARIRARIKPRTEVNPSKPRQQRRKKTQKKSGGQNQNARAGNNNRGNNKSEGKRERGNSKMRNSEGGERKPMMDKDRQEELLKEFFEGLLEAWQFPFEISFNWPKDYICEISLTGEDLNELIGDNAETLHSLENVGAVVLKKNAENTRYAQVRLNINDYREKRQKALESFVLKLADEVREAGRPKILEPMDNQDRKIVHNVLGDVEGIETVSEGENPRRRVKIFLAETE